MDGFFSLKKDGSEEIDDGRTIEVDRLSFNSFDQSSDDDLYLSVFESPSASPTDFPADSISLTLTCAHNDSIASCCDEVEPEHVELSLDVSEPGCSNISCYSDALDTTWTERVEEDDEDDDDDEDFLNSLPSVSSLPPIPPIIREFPYWKDYQDWLRCLRNSDAEISKDLEDLNVTIYSSALAMKALEEARWLNDVSKDPELSKLLHDIDPIFPLAMLHTDVLHTDYGLSSESLNFDLTEKKTDNSTFYIPTPRRDCSVSNEAKVESDYNGVDEIIVRRKYDPQWYDIAAASLHRAFLRDPVRDPRIEEWTNDLMQHFAKSLSLPSTSSNSSEIMVDGQVVRLRGSNDWAPPRDAWIFTPLKTDNLKILLEGQNMRCAGCGIKLDKNYMKRVRLCEYYGKAFCHCCHQGSKSIIPAKILLNWNFKEFPVSDRAFRFLNEARDLPAIHILTLSPTLINKVSALKKVITMREKLNHMWEFLKICPEAEETITKHGNLKTLFTSLVPHLLSASDVFSLSDLTRVHSKELGSHLEPIVNYGKCHIETCHSCNAHAFVCSICGDATDLLFPFQLERISRCEKCGSLAHLKCEAAAKKKNPDALKECAKCVRIQKQRNSRRIISCGDV